MLDNEKTAWICRALSEMLQAGIGLTEGIYLLAAEDDSLGNVMQKMGSRLDAGVPLHCAMAESGIFPDYAVRLAGIGEETGRQEEALKSLADYYDEQSRTVSYIRSATAYPAMVFAVMITVLAVLLIKVLPIFEKVYASLGVRMEGTAAGLLYLGQILKNGMPVLLTVLVLLAVCVLGYVLWSPLRKMIDQHIISRFADRGIARKFNNARFIRGLSMGLRSGLPMETAMELASDLLQDIPQAVLRCDAARAVQQENGSIREALLAGELLTPGQCQVLHVGIQGGYGDAAMERIAQQSMEEARNAMNRAISRLEPAMVTVASALVGIILLAVMLPLVDILSAIG